jgi:hypothetical protein
MVLSFEKRLFVYLLLIHFSNAGPTARKYFYSMKFNKSKLGLFFTVAICYSGCATLQCACYAAAAGVFGTITAGIGIGIVYI